MCWQAISSFAELNRIEGVIMVHRYTSVYIKWNEVELRLGANIAVHARSIVLAYS
jgi:hypothetical protein